MKPNLFYLRWLILLATILTGRTWAQEAKVRTSLATPGDLWVGQRITLVVELLVPGFFSGTAAFDLPDPQGLLLVPPSDRPVVSSEEIDGVSYAVQRHELAVFAQRGGPQTVPAFAVRFHFKRQPLDPEAVKATVHTEPQKFTTKLPAGAEKLGSLISARNLKAAETWNPELGKAKVGDAFTRTIEFTAPEVPAMAFPPFPANEIQGLGIYPKAPQVFDHSDRGTLHGERRDTITYVCQRTGLATIPAVRFTWFDLDSQMLQTIDFPARNLDVGPNPAMASAAASTSQNEPSHTWKTVTFALCAVLLLDALCILAWKTRFVWQPLIDALRPVHLQLLNPPTLVPPAFKAKF